MKHILALLLLIPVFTIAQVKKCEYDIDEKTDSTSIKITPQKLINEKNKIESSLKNQRTIISLILLITILASLFYWNRYNSLQKKYR